MTETRRINPLLFIPGALVWALIIAGAVMKDGVLIGIGVAVIVATIAVRIVTMVRKSDADRAERKRLWEQGRPATARIVAIGTNGGGMNNHPRVDFELDVSINGDSPYRVTTSALISKLAIPRIQPGCEIAVRVDPRDRKNLVVDTALTPYGY